MKIKKEIMANIWKVATFLSLTLMNVSTVNHVKVYKYEWTDNKTVPQSKQFLTVKMRTWLPNGRYGITVEMKAVYGKLLLIDYCSFPYNWVLDPKGNYISDSEESAVLVAIQMAFRQKGVELFLNNRYNKYNGVNWSRWNVN